jgi:hypothetical protein
MAPIPTIDETQRKIAELARHTMATYRAYKGIGPYHLSAADTVLFPWPKPHQVAGVKALGERADTRIAVSLLASDETDGGPYGAADELEIAVHRRDGEQIIVIVHRSPQSTMELLTPPPDAALLPVLRWACRLATEGSY